MARFIEIHRKTAGRPMLINIDNLVFIEPNDADDEARGCHVRLIDYGFDAAESYAEVITAIESERERARMASILEDDPRGRTLPSPS